MMIVPAIVWLLLGAIAIGCGAANGLGDALRRLALPLALIVAAGHMAKGLAKFVTWIGFVPLALRDPAGVETARAVAGGSLPMPATVLPMPAVSFIAALLVLLAGWFAYREFRLSEGRAAKRFLVPVVLLTGFFLFLVVGWGLPAAWR